MEEKPTRESVTQDLYHCAFAVAYYAKDECQDYRPNSKRYWMDLGMKIQSLYQAVENFADIERKERAAEQVEPRRRTGRRQKIT